MTSRILLIALLLLSWNVPAWADQPKTILYKGKNSSSYALSSLIFAGLARPDFFELPLLLTRDNIPVVFDDLFLHPDTNVAQLFPDRSRADGNFYLIDFDLFEIEQLSFRKDTDGEKIPTLHPVAFTDALQTISRLGKSLSHQFDILPVIKYPWFHTNENKDISTVILDTMVAHTDSPERTLFLKSYDPDELQRIHKDLLPGLPVEFRLVQGVDVPGGTETMRLNRDSWESYNYEWLFTRLGLRVASGYAYGLVLMEPESIDETTLQRVIEDSHGLKMKIFLNGVHIPDDTIESFSTRFLFGLNADGLVLGSPAALHTFFTTRETPPLLSPGHDVIQEEQSNGNISDDPEVLIRRLQKAL